MLFHDRTDAGRVLAEKLTHYRDTPVVELALPRGGGPVAYVIARALHAPLDVFLVRKLGVPGHEERAMGSTAGGAVRTINREAVDYLHTPKHAIHTGAAKDLQEKKRQEKGYRHNRPFPVIEGKT